jgi:hypothetical protein
MVFSSDGKPFLLSARHPTKLDELFICQLKIRLAILRSCHCYFYLYNVIFHCVFSLYIGCSLSQIKINMDFSPILIITLFDIAFTGYIFSHDMAVNICSEIPI